MIVDPLITIANPVYSGVFGDDADTAMVLANMRVVCAAGYALSFKRWATQQRHANHDQLYL